MQLFLETPTFLVVLSETENLWKNTDLSFSLATSRTIKS